MNITWATLTIPMRVPQYFMQPTEQTAIILKNKTFLISLIDFLEVTTPLTPVLEYEQSQDYCGGLQEIELPIDDDRLQKRASIIYSRRNRLTRSRPCRKAVRKRPRRFSKCKLKFSRKIITENFSEKSENPARNESLIHFDSKSA